MSATLYTPGPWTFKDGLQLAVGPEADPEGQAVAHVVNHPGEAFANARLIARAPELLAALDRCLAFWDEPPSGFGCNAERKTKLDAIRRDARAIIAKAKGEA